MVDVVVGAGTHATRPQNKHAQCMIGLGGWRHTENVGGGGVGKVVAARTCVVARKGRGRRAAATSHPTNHRGVDSLPANPHTRSSMLHWCIVRRQSGGWRTFSGSWTSSRTLRPRHPPICSFFHTNQGPPPPAIGKEWYTGAFRRGGGTWGRALDGTRPENRPPLQNTAPARRWVAPFFRVGVTPSHHHQCNQESELSLVVGVAGAGTVSGWGWARWVGRGGAVCAARARWVSLGGRVDVVAVRFSVLFSRRRTVVRTPNQNRKFSANAQQQRSLRTCN